MSVRFNSPLSVIFRRSVQLRRAGRSSTGTTTWAGKVASVPTSTTEPIVMTATVLLDTCKCILIT